MILEQIFISAHKGAALQPLFEVSVMEGRGLEGDRYFDGRGSFSRWPGGGRAVSMIAAEAIEAIATEHGIDLSNGMHRRNLVSRSVCLEDLVGKTFGIGQAIFYGDRLVRPLSIPGAIDCSGPV